MLPCVQKPGTVGPQGTKNGNTPVRTDETHRRTWSVAPHTTKTHRSPDRRRAGDTTYTGRRTRHVDTRTVAVSCPTRESEDCAGYWTAGYPAG